MAGGALKPADRSYTVSVNRGAINVQFLATLFTAQVNALEILRLQ
jgi:hypothetical protein